MFKHIRVEKKNKLPGSCPESNWRSGLFFLVPHLLERPSPELCLDKYTTLNGI